MILYNTTFVLAPSTEIDFLSFMREVYIPALKADALVHTPRLHRITTQPMPSPSLFTSTPKGSLTCRTSYRTPAFA